MSPFLRTMTLLLAGLLAMSALASAQTTTTGSGTYETTATLGEECADLLAGSTATNTTGATGGGPGFPECMTPSNVTMPPGATMLALNLTNDGEEDLCIEIRTGTNVTSASSNASGGTGSTSGGSGTGACADAGTTTGGQSVSGTTSTSTGCDAASASSTREPTLVKAGESRLVCVSVSGNMTVYLADAGVAIGRIGAASAGAGTGTGSGTGTSAGNGTGTGNGSGTGGNDTAGGEESTRDNGTPGPALALVLVGLAAVAVALRRR